MEPDLFRESPKQEPVKLKTPKNGSEELGASSF